MLSDSRPGSPPTRPAAIALVGDRCRNASAGRGRRDRDRSRAGHAVPAASFWRIACSLEALRDLEPQCFSTTSRAYPGPRAGECATQRTRGWTSGDVVPPRDVGAAARAVRRVLGSLPAPGVDKAALEAGSDGPRRSRDVARVVCDVSVCVRAPCFDGQRRAARCEAAR
jgi:hypothetical protein